MQGMTTGMPLDESQATVPDRLRQQWLARLVPVPLPEGALRPSLSSGGRMSGEGRHPMCLDCGCGEPNERHGDDRHIVMDDIRRGRGLRDLGG